MTVTEPPEVPSDEVERLNIAALVPDRASAIPEERLAPVMVIALVAVVLTTA